MWPPRNPHTSPTASPLWCHARGARVASILLKFVSDITLEFRFPKIRILDPINSRVPRPYGVVLPSSGTPFLVVSENFTWDTPPPKFCVYSNFTIFHTRYAPLRQCGLCPLPAHSFTRFYPNMGLPRPNYYICFLVFLRICTPTF